MNDPSVPGEAVPGQAISLAIDIGWTMALLFGEMRSSFSENRPLVNDRLPTEAQLPGAERIKLQERRINVLLVRLGALLPASPEVKPGTPLLQLTSSAEVPPDPSPAVRTDQEIIKQANLAILEWLALAGRELSVAYQLGRALRDTADPPLRAHAAGLGQSEPDIDDRASAAARHLTPAQANWELAAREAIIAQLSRQRVAKLQDWLFLLAPNLPPDSASIVSVSIGWWCDLTTVIFSPTAPGRLSRGGRELSDVSGQLVRSLLPQGDVWINLLAGSRSSDGLLTPAGYARIIDRTIIRYFFMLLVLVAVLAAALFFINQEISGVGKVWTMIVAIAGAIGVTAKGITTTVARFSGSAGKPIFGMARIEAMAWAATTMPEGLRLNIRGVRALRRSGILPPAPSGRH
jgi:hypothetical protein